MRSRLKVLNDALNKKQIEKINLLAASNKFSADIFVLEEDIREIEKMSDILTAVSTKAKENIISFLEDIVTDALSYISEGQYRFKIEMDSTGKSTKCDFYVVEDVDGHESKQDPRDSCGGGFIDIISTTLRYVYLNLYNVSKINGPIILDEPGKMVSQDMSIKFAEFVKKLGDDFDRQTIMITHNSNLASIGDNTLTVTK